MTKHLAALIGGFAAAGVLAYGIERRRGRTSHQQESRAGQRRERRDQRHIEQVTAEFDLNSCSIEELSRNRDIGPELAERIAENRPYRNKLDLVARRVVPQDVYDAIKHHIRVDDAGEAVKVA